MNKTIKCSWWGLVKSSRSLNKNGCPRPCWWKKMIWLKRNKNIFKNISSDYEKVFRSYLDRTTDFQENLGMFSLTRSQSLYSEINELKDKVKQLESKLKKIEKK